MCAGTPGRDLAFWIYEAPADRVDEGAWTATGEYTCRGGEEATEDQAPEPVVTLEDFRRLPLPAGRVRVQPPNLRTLVNIPTNVYADAAPVVLPTTVLGQAVRVRATPARFSWSYGDGTKRTVERAGGPYPDLSTAHTYRAPGRHAVQLTTSYSGEYSVAGGAWLPITGVATVTGPTTTLTVLTAENQLVEDPLN